MKKSIIILLLATFGYNTYAQDEMDEVDQVANAASVASAVAGGVLSFFGGDGVIHTANWIENMNQTQAALESVQKAAEQIEKLNGVRKSIESLGELTKQMQKDANAISDVARYKSAAWDILVDKLNLDEPLYTEYYDFNDAYLDLTDNFRSRDGEISHEKMLYNLEAATTKLRLEKSLNKKDVDQELVIHSRILASELKREQYVQNAHSFSQLAKYHATSAMMLKFFLQMKITGVELSTYGSTLRNKKDQEAKDAIKNDKTKLTREEIQQKTEALEEHIEKAIFYRAEAQRYYELIYKREFYDADMKETLMAAERAIETEKATTELLNNFFVSNVSESARRTARQKSYYERYNY